MARCAEFCRAIGQYGIFRLGRSVLILHLPLFSLRRNLRLTWARTGLPPMFRLQNDRMGNCIPPLLSGFVRNRVGFELQGVMHSLRVINL